RAQVAAGVIKHHGLPESIAMVADGLGFALDDISETIEPITAKETVKTEFLEVAPGQVAGVHQIARGTTAGKEKIFMELQMYVGAKHPADSVELRGESRANNSRRHARRYRHHSRSRQRHPGNPRRSRRPPHRPRPAANLLPAHLTGFCSCTGTACWARRTCLL